MIVQSDVLRIMCFLDPVYNPDFLAKISKLTVFLLNQKDFRRTFLRHLSLPPHQILWEISVQGFVMLYGTMLELLI